MKITKTQLQKIVLETLKEAKAAKKRLLEAEVATPDIQNIVTVLDKTPRFDLMVQKINTRQEFFEFLEWIVDEGDDNLPGDSDVIIAIKQTLENALKRKQQRSQGGEASRQIKNDIGRDQDLQSFMEGIKAELESQDGSVQDFTDVLLKVIRAMQIPENDKDTREVMGNTVYELIEKMPEEKKPYGGTQNEDYFFSLVRKYVK